MISIFKQSAFQLSQTPFSLSFGSFKRNFMNKTQSTTDSSVNNNPEKDLNKQPEKDLNTKPEKDEKTVLQEKVIGLEKELKESKDTLLRSLAEQQNQSKRLRKQMKETRNFAVTDFSKSLLEIADNLQRALKNSAKPSDELSKEYKSLHEGVVLTEKILHKVFAKYGIVQIDCKQGDKFDYKVHNAVLTLANSKFNDGELGLIIQRGYKIKERILRAARVGVVKKEAEEEKKN
ncbi:grpe protein [Anaeramoeba flamelloides]|uniref:GrpE protein homolog n=1 Tax=Anaeramoeba flamelloides TaxID=1746091 RepID=A0AAV8AAQ2_9EUKA|nr:grpe protein [Anaeramoeba flamelloides]